MLNRIKVAEEVLCGKTVFTILSSSGDDRLAYAVAEPTETDLGLIEFDKKMQEGFVAFPFDAKGNQVGQINKTDWEKLDRQEQRKALFDEPKEIQMIAPIVGG